MQKQNSSEHRMSFLYRFFCWCSGARLYILKQCPSDYNKYFGIGIIIFLTGMMATLSGGYAVFTVFRSVDISIAFGLFWGILIFFIDWYIVSSLKKENKTHKEVLASIPRLLLAVFLAFIISKPLEMKLFEREINQQIEKQKREKSLDYKQIIDTEFEEIVKIEQQNEILQTEIRTKENQRNKLFDMFIAEAEGNSGTGIVGKGPVYREKKAEYDKIEAELNQLRTDNQKQIKLNNEQIAQLKTERDNVMKSGKQATENYDGFLARFETLETLSAENRIIMFINWFIVLLFIAIESAPIFVKLISKRGPYDEMIDFEEFQVLLKARKKKAGMKADAERELELELEKTKIRHEAGLKASQNLIDQAAEAQAEINMRKVTYWKEKEIEQIKEKLDDLNQLLNTDFHHSEIDNTPIPEKFAENESSEKQKSETKATTETEKLTTKKPKSDD